MVVGGSQLVEVVSYWYEQSAVLLQLVAAVSICSTINNSVIGNGTVGCTCTIVGRNIGNNWGSHKVMVGILNVLVVKGIRISSRSCCQHQWYCKLSEVVLQVSVV